MSYSSEPMNLSIVILAAGKGTRMQSEIPKVLHKIAGKSMLSHVIDNVTDLSSNITVVIGHGAKLIRNTFCERSILKFIIQEQQNGTGHAVQQAIPNLIDSNDNDLTLILYGDVPLVQPRTLRRLIKAASQGLGLLTQEMTDPTGYGRIVRDQNQEVVRIVEQRDASPEEQKITEINTGILCVPTKKLKDWLGRITNNNAQGEYYLTDIIALAVADGVSINTVQPDHAWETAGVNSREQQAKLERQWQFEQARSIMKRGVTLIDPHRFDLRGHLECGQDVSIDANCIFEGKVELGDNVQIGPNCIIRDARIGDNTQIHAFTHIEDAIIGHNASVGPYARIRPGSQLGPSSHVGNFVELKKTKLGNGSKANHLSYLGDAEIGDRVNIGAGTITCNYDGANKHKTTIGTEAFIGSGTQLVAPVNVGKAATIGAGTTLRQDAPAGQLTLTKSEQVSKSNWKRPEKKAPKAE
ncbi:bifunctional UDP-N-acetylglucosamine diphosphorylase/glucosamine-1-phosphate N-acetyltransferase GlmU [Brackiella oedipodis]|uniref:bifunctional UDP-N-acetylglucosamine diphosphorylase/glucosamine-1-phosphate N-acetyltransferase GlmU n=1 Tax=Brackiella oedipodis TaxID=124225 RepID=UPI001FE1426F|nr:bifunctional UDP-N-acetylglucosamine diphosphorylase/glucosamine-1-phosphate N-acetyltransferase GlmU [Brackiella oedipodis]